LLAVGALALTACRGPSCPADLLKDPSQVLSTQRTRAEGIHSLKAEARIDQRSDKGRIKGRVLMFVERPERVRFDAMTQFGPALTLTSDGNELALSDFKDNRYLTGATCPSNIARLIGVALSGPDVVSALLGDAPPFESAHDTMQCSGQGSYLIDRRAQDGSRELLEFSIDPQDFAKKASDQRLTLSEVNVWNPAGKKLYRVRYEDYRSVGHGASLPFTVRIDDQSSKSDAVLRFEKIQVNVQVPEGAFRQEPRAGLQVEALTCE
jgi:outer membrane lipoprotein-sorting protein